MKGNLQNHPDLKQKFRCMEGTTIFLMAEERGAYDLKVKNLPRCLPRAECKKCTFFKQDQSFLASDVRSPICSVS